MKIGVIGLGRMGLNIALRLKQGGHDVVGYDPAITSHEFTCVKSIEAMACQVHIFWLMVPAGVVDATLASLEPFLRPHDIVIDGGNSFFKDSIRRAQALTQKDINFIDCGTSGGLHGADIGFSLMVGGVREVYEKLTPMFTSIAAPSGFAYMGPAGAGHYVKMVHNGIEYALLQAYAEGFHLLKDGVYKDLDLKNIAHVWNHGSIIRSWICNLSEDVLARDTEFSNVSGAIAESGTGQWTVDTAKEVNIPVDMIERALAIRAESRATGGNYATKMVALLRHEFGGHLLGRGK